jgi:hypothetical protein
MGLPPVFKTKQPAVSFYITLLLSDSNIQTALWQLDDQGIGILSKSTVHEYGDDEQAVTQSDKALQVLGKKSEEVNDVVFGLPHTWVDDQGVTAAKKPLLKTLTEELSLKAVGFVVTSEAVAKHLIADNPRLSILLVEFGQHELYLSLISQGKLISTKFVGRSGDTMADMTEALARLNAHQEEEVKLPEKMIVSSLDLNSSELKDQQQLLLNHDWVNSHPFTHPPTVELLDQEVILEAVVEQGGSPITGKPVAKPKVEETTSKVIQEPEIIAKAKKEDLAIEVNPQKTQATSYGVPIKLDDLEKRIQPEIKPQDEVNLPHSIESKNESSSKIKMKFYSWFNEHKSFAIGGFFAGILALVVITGVWLNTGVKAVVELSLAVESISKETTIILNPNPNSTNVDELVLAAHTIEKNASGKKTKETTGVKVVGDQAKGKITLYNKVEAVKVFDQGTKISKGDLVFTLDEEVEVASASTKESAGSKKTEYGKKEVMVTATDIGADHNLAAETELQVASFDPGTYSATITESFAGGSSREVRVVSVGDRDQLVEELRKKLLDEAKQEIEENLEEGEYIASANIYKVSEQTLDAEISDEIGAVTLDLSITVRALTYKTEDLKPLAQKVLESDIPAGYTLANSEPQIMSAPDQEASSSGVVSLLVNITSEAKPDLNWEELKQEISGKRIDEVKQTLVAKDDINSVEISLIPGIAAQLYPRVPKDPTKIEIQ